MPYLSLATPSCWTNIQFFKWAVVSALGLDPSFPLLWANSCFRFRSDCTSFTPSREPCRIHHAESGASSLPLWAVSLESRNCLVHQGSPRIQQYMVQSRYPNSASWGHVSHTPCPKSSTIFVAFSFPWAGKAVISKFG